MAFINTKCKLSAIRKQALLWSVESQHTTRNFDKHKKTFCARKENICLSSHTGEQHFHILFTSSQERR